MAYPELTDKQRNYPYSGNMQLPPLVPETRGVVSPTGATPEQTAQGKQNWQSNAPQQFANNPVGTVQYNIFKQKQQQTPVQNAGGQTVTDAVRAEREAGRKVWGDQGTGTLGEYNKRNKSIGSMEDLANAISYTSPEQEEKMRKASVANQRIMAIGDALRHIGNIANTVNYAPSQQFNNPVQEEHQRYLQGKALRDAANQRYLAYQQAKAAQDAKQRQWEQQFQYNTMKDARDYALRKSESDARNSLREAQLNRYQTMIELDNARKEGIISDNEWRKRRAELYPAEVQSRINKNNRTGSGRSGGSRGGGSNMPDYDVVTTYDRDDEGRVKSSKKTRTVKHTDGTTSTSTKATQPKKKALPGQTQTQPQKKTKKKLPGM